MKNITFTKKRFLSVVFFLLVASAGYCQEINVKGNGNTIYHNDNSPTTGDWTNFGSVNIAGSASITRTFTIENSSWLPLLIGNITFAGANAAEFSVTSAPAAVVWGGDSTTFMVTFNPSGVGQRNATIQIANTDSNENPYIFALRGTGTDPEIDVRGLSTSIPDGSTTPSTTNDTNFGVVNVASGTNPNTFTIYNLAGATSALTISGITVTGANASDFTITSNVGTTSVGVGSSTNFTITFNPSAGGTRNALVTIMTNDSDESPYTFAISGVGAAPEINVVGNGSNIASGDTTPSLTDHTDFGVIDISIGNVVRTFTIQNTSAATANLSIGAITMTGANAGEFTISGLGSNNLAPGASTTFQVTFNPTASGVRNATVNIVNNDSDESPYTFAVRGSGGSPEITVKGNGNTINDNDTTPNLGDNTNFGSALVAGGTVTMPFVIHNLGTGTAPLTLGSITITGANASDFTITTYPASTIAVNGSTTLAITFNPSATGSRTATVNIPNNDADENPYNFSIAGTGSDPEINVVGNMISIVDGDTTPSVSDNTDFGSASIDSGYAIVTYTIQNTGIGNLSVDGVTISGTHAASYTVLTAPASTVSQGSSTTFQIRFAPTTVGVKNAMISIENDDSNENPYNFAITGLGVRTYPDTDGDGISDNIDIDDDNDGILDTLEQSYCLQSPFASTVTHTFLNETFGAGTTKGLININIPGATCTYCFEDGIVGPNTPACPSQSSWILDDGEYVVTHKIAGTSANDPENIHGDLAWNGLVDHTPGDVNGRMAVFNASYTPGIFYETTVNGIIPNVPITYSFWALNILSKSVYNNSILPNITVEFLDSSGNILSTYNTGNIGRCGTTTSDNSCQYSEWRQYTTSVNLGNNTSFTIRFKNNAPGGGGNDLALDDIEIKQQYCDRDGDGIANIYDLDSDNDGIPDVEEAGFKNLTAKKGYVNMAAGAWVDANGNGLHDAIDAMIASSTYVIPDTDGDGTPDILDLDSDNDSIFDIDEAGLINGDGDINGDGLGDGLDSDSDGILDLHDTFNGYGTDVRDYALDTDGNGTPDYLQLDSDGNGSKDIIQTLYSGYDLNNDGIIDGTADADKDGILDTFDTAHSALGSPRDLNLKLYLDLDGRNDYVQGRQMLSGLAKATMMGWIKIDNSFTGNATVVGQDNFNIKIENTGGIIRAVTRANGTALFATMPLSTEKWYHLAAVYDGSNPTEKLQLYINGRREATVNASGLSGTLHTSTARLTMGKNPLLGFEYLKGSIDEVRVFNTALTTDQIQKMVYQEIKANGAAIRGEVIPKDIESTTWASLIGYYRMDAYKDDVIDDYTSSSIDAGNNVNYARIYNVKNLKTQLAPMPFVTSTSAPIDVAVSQNNFINGADVLNYEWSILNVKHNITFSSNYTNLGLLIDPSVQVDLNNDNVLRNTWYLRLNGKLDLKGRSQLVQTETSDLDAASSGFIERDQQGQTNRFNYNYWSSPVGAINNTTNNNSYTVAGVMKDGTNPAAPQNINWTTGLNGSATSPITLSSYWIFKFQNVANNYANWSSVGQNGSLLAGQGFTLKGSNATSPNQNYVFIGKPHNGPITASVAPNNLNLCGNPYASALDADAFILANKTSTTGTIYFWEHFPTNNTHNLVDYQGGYAARTLVGGTPPVSPTEISGLGSSARTPGRFIPVGQGFFVTGSTTGGTINFNNAQRAFVRENHAQSNVMFRADSQLTSSEFDNSEDYFEPDTYPRLRLGFDSANNYHRQALLGFMGDDATEGLDVGYDALHIDNQPNDMYFLHNGSKLIIQGVGYFTSDKIYPLGVKTGQTGTVKFKLDGLENFDQEQQVYIHDKVTGLYHNIKTETFAIELPAGTVEDRFELTFEDGSEPALGTPESVLENGISVAYTSTNSMITIKNQIVGTDVETVTMFNMLGQEVAAWKVADMNQSNIELPVRNLSAGTYIIKIHTNGGDLNKKIAVK